MFFNSFIINEKPRGRQHLAALAAVLMLSACTDPSAPQIADAMSPPAAGPRSASAPSNLAGLAAAHQADPADAAAATAYAKALRTTGARTEALAVLDTASKAAPGNRRLTLERGLLTLELGDPAKAETLLRAAHDPKAPDWRLHSALGAALASRGKQAEAQAQFAKALALAPDHPSILNNLALSHALSGKGDEAEKLLRKAAGGRGGPDTGRVQQNLALVLGLAGKYEEAQTVAAAALPAAKAGDNIAYLKTLTEARTAASPAGSWAPVLKTEAAPKASASLPQPTYQLGGPPAAGK
jgi:Flp pilus assembly protein TadD